MRAGDTDGNVNATSTDAPRCGTSETAPTRTAGGVAGWSVVVIGLPLGAIVGLVFLWRPPSPAELLVAAVTYTLGGLGISLGWHRYFTHRGFRCYRNVERSLALAGCLAFEGSLASWVANHRVHHQHTDVAGDPHSPWTEGSRLRGFLHAHVGWLNRQGAPEQRYAKDVLRDPALRKISRLWWLVGLSGMILPAVISGALGGVSAFWGMFLWAGVVRVVLFHHVTWSVNSICHMYGSRRFDVPDQSRNVWWLALPSFGESWHNNHHRSPRTARHGVGHREIDLSALLLRLLERTRLATECHWGQRH